MAMPDTRPFPRPRSRRTVWTVADLERLTDDGNRSEILHGELLVTPLPLTQHERIAMRLSVLTVLWCRADKDGRYWHLAASRLDARLIPFGQ